MRAARGRPKRCSTRACRSSPSATASRRWPCSLGGKVEGGHAREFGRADVEIKEPSALYQGVWEIGGRYPVWMSHGDRVTELPPGFKVVATSPNAPFAIAVNEAEEALHHDVPPRGGAHARWRQTARQLRPQHRRAEVGLDDVGLSRAYDRQDPRAGREGPGDLRALGRRRLVGCGGADPRGDRRPADLHFRRSRADAAQRGRRGRADVPRQLQHPADPR